jgi:dynein light chain roadblock-type
LCVLWQYAAMISSLALKARAVLKELPLPGAVADSAANELQVLRLRTQHHEIMVAPDRDYLLIVVQGSPQKAATATSPGAAGL